MGRVRDLLYPKLTWRQLVWMLLFGLGGALIAGAYGIMHDQVTYSLGPEYFTCFKFSQFSYLDFSRPPRIVVAQIGFLASWWVGFFAAWFMGRLALPVVPLHLAFRLCVKGVLGMLVLTLASGVLAGCLAPGEGERGLENWRGMVAMFHVSDTASFVRVGWIHNGSYIGALVGLLLALIWLKRMLPRAAAAPRL